MLEYYNALERLKKNRSNVVKKGSIITKSSVAREAGKDPSAIKTSRSEFTILIEEINSAAEQLGRPVHDLQLRYDKMKKSRDDYKLRMRRR